MKTRADLESELRVLEAKLEEVRKGLELLGKACALCKDCVRFTQHNAYDGCCSELEGYFNQIGFRSDFSPDDTLDRVKGEVFVWERCDLFIPKNRRSENDPNE